MADSPATDPYACSVWKSSTADNIRVQIAAQQSANVAITAPVAASRPVLLNIDGTPQIYFHVLTSNSANKGAFVATVASPPVVSAQTDADLPETTLIGSFAGLDGYLFIATSDGSIYNSDLNNDTSWTSTSFLDNHFQNYGRGVFNYKDKIGLFTEDTIEFYENVGNPIGSPLQRIDHLTQRSVGLGLSADSEIDTSSWYLSAFDTVFWINHARSGGDGVYMLKDFRAVKISSPDVDFNLALCNTEGVHLVGAFHLWGMKHLAVSVLTTAGGTAYCWIYNVDLGLWSTWESPLCASGASVMGIIDDDNEIGLGFSPARAFIGTAYYAFDTSSMLYSSISYADNGSAYTGTIQTRVLDFGTNNRKRFKSVSLLGPDPRETSNGTITTSLDDGQNFGNSRTIDLNSIDDRRIFRQGVARRIQWRIAHSDDAACELEELEVDYEDLGR